MFDYLKFYEFLDESKNLHTRVSFRVVTGLRFIKHKRVIHLQIQEGKLLPRGKIDLETVQWVPVHDYTPLDRKVYRGQDFHTLSWEKRAMDLDDLVGDEGHLVTGKNVNLDSPTCFADAYVCLQEFVSKKSERT